MTATAPGAARIPAFVNRRGGSAAKATAALGDAGAFDVHAVEPGALPDAVRDAVAAGARRVAVCGGDGTLAGAAAILAGSGVELAVIPGGTLNHFARALGIPDDHAAAAALAGAGRARAVDVGYVNDRLMLNTCSVGAYVTFVRTRERFEQRGLPYLLASLLAAVGSMVRVRNFRLLLEIEGEARVYQTPIFFVAIGERQLRLPGMSDHLPDGRRGLHVVAFRGRGRARMLLLGAAIAARGVHAVARTTEDVDSFVVDACRLEMRRPRPNVGMDGEIVPMDAPLDYRHARDALQVVVPDAAG